MAIGGCGWLSIDIGVYGGLWRPMDTNRWLLEHVDTNGKPLVLMEAHGC